MKRIALILLLLASYAHNAFAAPQGEYKAFSYTQALGCLGLTTEYGGIPDCYDTFQFDARYVWSPTLKYYTPATLPFLTVAQLPTCNATIAEIHFSEAVISDSLNVCTAGNTIAGGGTGNTCIVACVENSSTWAWNIIGSLGGGGGGGVAAIGANPPIFLTGTASVPVVNLAVPLAAQYGGTGTTSPTAHTVAVAEGSSAFNFLTGTLNKPLIGQGAGSDPTFTALNLAGVGVTGVLPVGNGGTGCPSPVTVATLPSAAQGDVCTVTDSTNTCVDGSTITGGGSNVCVVFYNGSAWQMVGTVSGASGGTVTSVGMTVPIGLAVTPSSITSSGTFAVTWATTTVGGLSSCNSAAKGSYDTVTDSTSVCQAGNVLSGSGLNVCSVYCNGSAWAIVGTVAPNATGGTILVANGVSPGTTVNELASYDTSGNPSAVLPSSTSVGPFIGIVTQGAGTSGFATIQTSGSVGCVFDGATTSGHAVIASTTTGGECHDAGSATPNTNSEVLGTIPTTNGSAGTYTMTLQIPWAVALGGQQVCDKSVLDANAYHLFILSNGSGISTFCNNQSSPTIQGVYRWAAQQVFLGGNKAVDIQANSHESFGEEGTGGPSAASCGGTTSVNANSTDSVGSITVGATGPPSACTLTFVNAFNRAFCIAQDDSHAVVLTVTTPATSTMTITGASAIGGDTINYQCFDTD